MSAESSARALREHLASARASLEAGDQASARQAIEAALSIEVDEFGELVHRLAPSASAGANPTVLDAGISADAFARFEKRATQKRLTRCIASAEQAIVAADIDTARAAIDEIRELDRDNSQLRGLEQSLHDLEAAGKPAEPKHREPANVAGNTAGNRSRSVDGPLRTVEVSPRTARVPLQRVEVPQTVSPRPRFADIPAAASASYEPADVELFKAVNDASSTDDGNRGLRSGVVVVMLLLASVLVGWVAATGTQRIGLFSSERADSPTADAASAPQQLPEVSADLPKVSTAPNVSANQPGGDKQPQPAGSAARDGEEGGHREKGSNRTEPTTAKPEAAAIASDENQIRDELERYRMAYATLDIDALRRVSPGVDDSLAQKFATLKAEDLVFDSCRIHVASMTATAVCRGVARFIPKDGRPDMHVEARGWGFSLRRQPTGWQIESARETE
jgi:hypothetical protein